MTVQESLLFNEDHDKDSSKEKLKALPLLKTIH